MTSYPYQEQLRNMLDETADGKKLLIAPRSAGKRTALEQRRQQFFARHRCSACHKSLNDFHPYDDYMLETALWTRVHSEGLKGFLCHHCLEKRLAALGHTLTRQDFRPCLAYLNRMINPPSAEQLAQTPGVWRELITRQDGFVDHYGLPALPAFLAHLKAPL